MSHARGTQKRHDRRKNRYIMNTLFYALDIAHRRSISPPTIMDRFLDQLKTSLNLEKKVTSDDLRGRG